MNIISFNNFPLLFNLSIVLPCNMHINKNVLCFSAYLFIAKNKIETKFCNTAQLEMWVMSSFWLHHIHEENERKCYQFRSVPLENILFPIFDDCL